MIRCALVLDGSFLVLVAVASACTTRTTPGDLPDTCAVEACAGSEMPNGRVCRDGSHGGPTGRCIRHSAGCDWELRGCPEENERAMSLSEPPRTTPDFDPSRVSGGIRSLQGSINRCYAAALARSPSLEGRVGVQFVVLESGEVAEVIVTGPSEMLNSCIANAIRSLRFSPGPVGGRVRYSTTFVFTSDESGAGSRDGGAP